MIRTCWRNNARNLGHVTAFHFHADRDFGGGRHQRDDAARVDQHQGISFDFLLRKCSAKLLVFLSLKTIIQLLFSGRELPLEQRIDYTPLAMEKLGVFALYQGYH